MHLSIPMFLRRFFPLLLLLSCTAGAFAANSSDATQPTFPTALEAYGDEGVESLGPKLLGRIKTDPFNIVASVIFLLAIIHTFLAAKFRQISHHFEHDYEHLQRHRPSNPEETKAFLRKLDHKKFWSVVFHFLGEVEAVFGIWLIPLTIAIIAMKGLGTAEHYINGVNFTEPIFVVVIMAIASSKPILFFAEGALKRVADIGKGTPAAWWLSIMTVGPLLGSFITEPAAMTICALLLVSKFFKLQPSMPLRYATIGLLFVHVSIGGTLTHFAAPPVVMVAATWNWDTLFMIQHFGWKSVISIVIANSAVFFYFRKELSELRPSADSELQPEEKIPTSIIISHLLFIGLVVYTAHYAALVVLVFMFFLAFVAATERNQDVISLRSPVLVGFFLAGLVIHGGCQKWWIEPVLTSLNPVQLMLGATVLTAFNDNAAITYLASLVPGFTDQAKLAVVAGAVAGGGLTVIANAPNPAGQSILQSYFGTNGVDAFKLFLAALIPTAICLILFLLLP